MKVYSCGQEHPAVIFDGDVICPCGYLAVDYDKWIATDKKPVKSEESK